ncbi:hypothetical protein LguiB_012802 [Lonicera macranthoides]
MERSHFHLYWLGSGQHSEMECDVAVDSPWYYSEASPGSGKKDWAADPLHY